MAQRKPFPPEPETRPDARRAKTVPARESSPFARTPHDDVAPPVEDVSEDGAELEEKRKKERAQAPTMPPQSARAASGPGSRRPRGQSPHAKGVSDVRSVGPSLPAATIDEVTADLTRDPRRDSDD